MVLDFNDRSEARHANNNNTGSHQGYRFPSMPRFWRGLRLHNSQYPTGWIQSIIHLRAFGLFFGFFLLKINMELKMALGPDNWAYMILIEKGQFYMALYLAAIEKTKFHLK